MNAVEFADAPITSAPHVTYPWGVVCAQVHTESGRYDTYHRVELKELEGQLSPRRSEQLDAEGVQGLVQQLQAGTGLSTQWLDDRWVAVGSAQFAWWVPAGVRSLFFTQTRRNRTTTQTLHVPLPPLLMVAKAGRFCVFALRANRKPTPESELFHSPLMNFFRDGALCWGSVPVPPLQMGSRAQFEAAVFDTLNTHVNHDRVLRLGHGVTSEDYLSSMATLEGQKRFPFKWLSPFGQRAGDVIQ